MKTEMVQVLDSIRDVCERDGIWLYQVGTSLRSKTFGDLDLLLVTDSNETIHTDAIEALHSSIGLPLGQVATFDPCPEEVKLNLYKAIQPFERVELCWGIGPVVFTSSEESVLNIHVCGPMSSVEWNSFARKFPFHTLAFLALNRNLAGPHLCDVFERPKPSMLDLANWIECMSQRFDSASESRGDLKTLKKCLLSYYLCVGRLDPYQETEESVGKLISDGYTPQSATTLLLNEVRAGNSSFR